MQKIEVAALASERDRILATLSAMGTVEIEPVETTEKRVEEDTASALRDVVGLRARIASALKTIDTRFPLETKSMFSMHEDVTRAEYEDVLQNEASLMVSLDDFEKQLIHETELQNRIGQLRHQQSFIAPWRGIPLDLAELETATMTIIYGVSMEIADIEAFSNALADDVPGTVVTPLNEPTDARRLLAVAVRKADAAQVRSRLASAGFQPLPMTGERGTPDQVFARYEGDMATLEKELVDNKTLLQAFAGKRMRLKIWYDALAKREAELIAIDQIGYTTQTVYFSGWVPAKKAAKTVKKLLAIPGTAINVREPLDNEEYPVILENNRFNSAFESVLTLFGAPNNHESDPMPAMAPFYMLCFGLMLSDVGYGLLLTLGAAYLIYKVKVEGNMLSMSKMLFISGLASMAMGALFGGFFGDLLTVLTNGRVNFPVIWFDPMSAPMDLLIYSMIFGVIHLFVGMAMKIVNEKRFGNIWDGLFATVPWYLIMTGILAMLGSVTGVFGDGAFAAMASKVALWMIIAGAVLVIIGRMRTADNKFKGFFSGILGLYDITAWLSDILSYSRILALVLATSVIAMVFNSIAGMTLGLPTPLNYVMFAVIAIPTHLLNLALSALSAYVHASRLQYIEMFGKFFDGGGRYFKPLKHETKYINVPVADEAAAGDDM